MRDASSFGWSAESHSGHLSSVGRVRRRVLLIFALSILLSGCLAASARAATPERFFKGTFGSSSQPTFGSTWGLAIDESNGDLLVMDGAAGTISRYKPNGTPDDFSALGSNVISEAAGHGLVFGSPIESQIAVDNSGTATDGNIYVTDASGGAHVIDIFARSGEYLGSLSEGRNAEGNRIPFIGACGVAVDPAGAVYVGDGTGGVDKFVPTGAAPTNSDLDPAFTDLDDVCPIAAGAGASAGSLFAARGHPRQIVKLDATTGALDYVITQPGLSINPFYLSVIPSTGHLLVALASGSAPGEVTEYDASGATEATVTSRFAVGQNNFGAAGSPGEVFVSRGAEHIEVFSGVFPVPELETTQPTGPGEVALHGLVYPEEVPLSACRFEYGLISNPGFEAEVACEPPAASIPANAGPQQVGATVTGLLENATYRVRLTTTNATVTLRSVVGTFTAGAPQISDVRARDAGESSAILEAKIDPNGFDTTYRFDWGPTAAYGNSVPAQAVSVGAGNKPVLVTAELSGLATATSYHYRVVAASRQGVAETSDQEVETVDSCGLPDRRCLELVSPREPGPVSRPGLSSNEELNFQSSIYPGSLMYSVANGLPGTTKAAEVLYQAVRGPEGWASTQVGPPISEPNEVGGPGSRTAQTSALSADLSCGVVTSSQLLTADPGTRLVAELGGSNLYRRNPDGSYTAITKLPPENPTAELSEGQSLELNLYKVYGYSEHCSKVVFLSPFRYSNVPTVSSHLGGSQSPVYVYEWEEGTLRNVGVVPGNGEEVAVEATLGEPSAEPGATNVVSEDGSRVFFAAKRQKAANPEEAGKVGIFVREVRENGTVTRVTRDLSQSETGVPDRGALFQYATPDGSRVFFIANAGLTPVSSTTGFDLYEYDLETNRLTDLSVTSQGGGAEVGALGIEAGTGAPGGEGGFLGASRDGAQVYFAARGELVPGRGRSFAENAAANTFSIYGEHNGKVSYASVMTTEELRHKSSLRVSPDGRYLLYQSSADLTGYVSGGAPEAYLFDARSTTEPIVCVSCRQDGQPSVEPVGNNPVGSEERQNPFHPRARLIVRNGRPVVFFTSFDRLAPGAVSGSSNLYEWAHSQVFLITTEPHGLQNPPDNHGVVKENIEFMGADADGSDLYFNSPAALTWEDPDQRISVYDARVDGGFAPPPSPPSPCSSVVEGACQGPSASPPAVGSPSTSTFVGPVNKKPPCKKGFVRKKGKCVKKHGGKKNHGGKKKGSKKKHSAGSRHSKSHGNKTHGSSRAARHANADRGVGK
jgi:hypothetical protein